MSFLNSNSLLKSQQPGFSNTEALKPQEPIVPNEQMQLANREAIPRQAQRAAGYVPMLLGNKVGNGTNTGRANSSFHAENSGWDGELTTDGERPPRATFLSRSTALPWNSQEMQHQSTLNFLS